MPQATPETAAAFSPPFGLELPLHKSIRPLNTEPEASLPLWALMLTPGLTLGNISALTGRSVRTIIRYRNFAYKYSADSPDVIKRVVANILALTVSDAEQMSATRRGSHLSYWSRLAICDRRKAGVSKKDLARRFHCTERTIANVLAGSHSRFAPVSGLSKHRQTL